MTRKALRVLAAFAALATMSSLSPAFPGTGGQVSSEVQAKAAGIFDALRKIEAERGRPAPARAPAPGPASSPRSLVFSEAEFNAYVACRLDADNDPFVKAAEFKLLADDHIEGRIALDLGGKPASGLLPRRQDLLFAARIETRDGMIKIHMNKLFLGTQPLAPAFVDVIIGVVSRLQGVEPTSLEDWYDLPPGVVRLETRQGRVVVFY